MEEELVFLFSSRIVFRNYLKNENFSFSHYKDNVESLSDAGRVYIKELYPSNPPIGK